MLMTTLASRVKSRMAVLGLKQEDVAALAKLSQTAVQKIVSGKSKETRKLIQLSIALQCDPKWLGNGTGSPDTNVSNDLHGKDNILEGEYSVISQAGGYESPIGGIPALSREEAKNWRESLDKQLQQGAGKGMVIDEEVKALLTSNTFMFVIRGDSLSPRFKDGYKALIDPDKPAENGNWVLAEIAGDVVVRQLVIEAGDSKLVAINPNFDPKHLHDCRIIGRAVCITPPSEIL